LDRTQELSSVNLPGRTIWTQLSDEQLLAQCEVDTYRASGPGGQKRNKTSSAVRLRHRPSGLIVIAEESRSQHENKTRALKRLRVALYLQVREQMTQPLQAALLSHPDWQRSGLASQHLPRSVKQPQFWPAAGIILDVLLACQGRISEVAACLGVSTAQLVHFLRLDPKLWQQANHLRQQFGHPLLR
jgi:hypothetical protein